MVTEGTNGLQRVTTAYRGLEGVTEVTGVNKRLQEVREGYKGLQGFQGVTAGYKG